MKKVIVERLDESTNDIKEYEVIAEEEAIEAIDDFNIAENVVDNSIYDYGYTVEINLKTGEIYAGIDDGTFSLGDTTTIRCIYHQDAYDDGPFIGDSIRNEYCEFEAFNEQYQDWVNGIERKYDYEFNSDYYNDEYEAFIVEVLEEDIYEFKRNYYIETFEFEMGIHFDIYEDTHEFYEEAKAIIEL
ncbi:hypothetical protein [Clostridium ljungdahlii]|uniref:Uncharacterized protein n=1 Tax=Clostridium ljungdahlii TaxID=1538 RepID=A0A168PIS9_9CLOT|nr:hypothetical protein [Clostridium ljungdahlii]OAA87797.1 hypothetical protein WY13_01912 [Clostridium ljungdahlii]